MAVHRRAPVTRPGSLLVLTDPRLAAPALPRRSGHTSHVRADENLAVTRAELRRQAQALPAPAAAPLTRREARGRLAAANVAPEVAVEDLPDLAPEALALPALPADVPVVVETAAAIDAAPATLPTSPIDLPQIRAGRAAPAGDTAFGRVNSTSSEADDRPVADEGAPLFDESELDAFEAAARLFAFTGETPVQVAAAARDEGDLAPAAAREPARRGAGFKRMAAASFSIGVIGVVGLLTVGMTTPVEAVAAAQGGTAALSVLTPGDVDAEEEAIQAYVAPADVQNQGVVRNENYRTATIAEIAAESGISNFSSFFVNNPNSAIQWPFAVGVPMTYGFGMRSGRLHEGLDFVPGAGAPIQAIADGTVRIATESGGAFGVTVVIDHVIDGEMISSRYAHMQYGSLQVTPGQQVSVGTFLGRTGDTGRSFGAHTHFELLAGGTTAIDPLPWLREHAGG
ncbi:peptidoglycan DD-metalloendopeptidase family protein [Microbacterium lushaniae]|uniref:Peptidoglycan DD-metalloendopeptidase family protein n=1 Tax=Microbacterium lushaniae TaxID=2614639 RepID=A0A5J6L6L6_9MICO|nr:peptidoglycan DD-metalloendopeptidase family protein [Microbacterium lushaniae]